MKEYSVRVTIMAENESDLMERIEDSDNPIEGIIDGSVKEEELPTRIYTDAKGTKTLCEHKNWTELIGDGWKFIKPVGTANKVLMERDGYLNEFWEE